MKEEFSIEQERLHLIARLAEMELDAALVRKLHCLLFGVSLSKPKPDLSESPCAISLDELVEVLRQEELNPSEGITHEELKRRAAQW